MAEETQTKAVESAPAAEFVAVEAAAKEKVAVTEAPSPPPPEKVVEPEKPSEEAPPAPVREDKKPEGEEAAAAVPKSASFKEESNVVGDLEDPEKKALDELKQLIQAALANNEFTPPPPPPPPAALEEAKAEGPSASAPTEEPAPPGKPESDETPKPVEAEPPKPAEAEEPLKPVVVEETPPPKEEKAVVVDEDGAKTVEAIEKTVVPIAAPATEEVILAAPAEAAVEPEKEASGEAPAEEVFIWGVPLVGDEKSDTVLLKFLRAREFKVKETMAMIQGRGDLEEAVRRRLPPRGGPRPAGDGDGGFHARPRQGGPLRVLQRLWGISKQGDLFQGLRCVAVVVAGLEHEPMAVTAKHIELPCRLHRPWPLSPSSLFALNSPSPPTPNPFRHQIASHHPSFILLFSPTN